MGLERNWVVLFVGGASGTGKSSFAYELARFYGVNVLEADDIHQAIKAASTKELFPAIHYWNNGLDWMDVGVESNVKWLVDVSRELMPILKAVADRHIEDDLPVIIEGDFIHPDLGVSFQNSKVKSIYIRESEKDQVLQNYLAREGGELQHYRADISIAYTDWLTDACRKSGIPVIDAKPWNTAVGRAVEVL